MKLSDEYVKELDRRCKLAIGLKSAKEQITLMGTYLNANIPSLPRASRLKFERVLDEIARNTVLRD